LSSHFSIDIRLGVLVEQIYLCVGQKQFFFSFLKSLFLHYMLLNIIFPFPRSILLRVLHCKFQGGVAGDERLHKSKILKKLLKEQGSAGRIFGAVCSSPAVLHRQGLLKVI
jgi:hypothetical protein